MAEPDGRRDQPVDGQPVVELSGPPPVFDDPSYTLHCSRRGRDLAVEVYFFGRFAPDGRMRQAHMSTRMVAVDGADERGETTM
ncbi:hypothetical protein ABZ484_21590 [Streptomyces sp. NPDC006393]|uniref:hypothetical protein n=1 Tax=Streptomyces sp. NPDC006393 TaxID=3156763 RepID=UPI00340A567E